MSNAVGGSSSSHRYMSSGKQNFDSSAGNRALDGSTSTTSGSRRMPDGDVVQLRSPHDSGVIFPLSTTTHSARPFLLPSRRRSLVAIEAAASCRRSVNN